MNDFEEARNIANQENLDNTGMSSTWDGFEHGADWAKDYVMQKATKLIEKLPCKCNIHNTIVDVCERCEFLGKEK